MWGREGIQGLVHSQMQLCPGVQPVYFSCGTKTWNCRMIEIFITQFRFLVLIYKCYFMLLFLVNLHFKFSIFLSLQSLFHSVQNLVPIELDAFFSERIKLRRYFLFHCIDYWKTANIVVSSIFSLFWKLLNCLLSLFNFRVSCNIVKYNVNVVILHAHSRMLLAFPHSKFTFPMK